MISANIDPITNRSISENNSFSWAANSTLSYLGIHLVTPTSHLVLLNLSQLIAKLQKMVKDLPHSQASWAGRIAFYFICYMLYTFCTLPIPFLQSHLRRLQAILTSFIWNGKHPRINHSILCTPKPTGGMGAPNIMAY